MDTPGMRTGYVTGRVVVTVNDSSDPGSRFDTIAPSGWIYLTPRADRYPAGSGSLIVFPDRMSLPVDSEGYVTVPNAGGNPTGVRTIEVPVAPGMTWQVSGDVTIPAFPWQEGVERNRVVVHPFDIPVQEGETTDLADYLPIGVDTEHQTIWTRGAPGPGLNSITAADGELIFRWSDSRETRIGVPDAVEGPIGPRGYRGFEGPPGAVELTGVAPEILVGSDYTRVGGREVVQVGDVGAGMPILQSKARAEMWEAMRPGRSALWVEGAAPEETGALPAYFDAQTGEAPTRWTERFSVGSKIPTMHNNGYLAMMHAQAARWALTHDDTGNVSAPIDVVMRVRSPRTSPGGFSFGIIVGQSGTAGSESGTAAYFNYGSGSTPLFRLMEYVNGTGSSPLTAPAPDFTQWTWMRMNVDSEGWTRVRVWADGEPEPSAWTQSTSLLSIKSGRIGIFNPGNSDAQVSYFNARTDGHRAPIVVQ